MTVNKGGRMFREQHKRLRDDELPATDTATQRGALEARAQRGDKAASAALKAYREAQTEND